MAETEFYFNEPAQYGGAGGGSSSAIAAETVDGVTYVKFKLSSGGEGVSNDVSVSAPLHVTSVLLQDSIDNVYKQLKLLNARFEHEHSTGITEEDI